MTWAIELASSFTTGPACPQPIYLHWHGDAVPSWLDQLKDRMNGRFSDAAYAAARFVGICHANIDGNLSLGISSNDFSLADVRSKDRMEDRQPRKCGHSRRRYQRFHLESLWRLPGRSMEAAMTPSNQQRADRCREGDHRVLRRRRLSLEPRRFSRRCDALVPTPMARTFISLLPRLAATTSTNSMTNNKTKGE